MQMTSSDKQSIGINIMLLTTQPTRRQISHRISSGATGTATKVSVARTAYVINLNKAHMYPAAKGVDRQLVNV